MASYYAAAYYQQPASFVLFGIRQGVQPECGRQPATGQPVEFDVWLGAQPELGAHPLTQQCLLSFTFVTSETASRYPVAW